MKPRILLTLVGEYDPYFQGLNKDIQQTGPIITALNKIQIDEIYLIVSPCQPKEKAVETRLAIKEKYPHVKCHTPIFINNQHKNKSSDLDLFSVLEQTDNKTRSIVSKIKSTNIVLLRTSGLSDDFDRMLQQSMAYAVSDGYYAYVRPPLYVGDTESIIGMLEINAPEGAQFEIPYIYKQTIKGTSKLYPISSELGIIGQDLKHLKAIDLCSRYASQDDPVLITGPTGSGKELFAKLIYKLSDRKEKCFKSISLLEVPETLIDAKLFGHEKGAYTNATIDKIGCIEEADGGTLFLDEIGELPINIQVKLLRVIQEGIVTRLGSNKQKKVDVRYIFATNRDLNEKDFRADLYQRISTFRVTLPSLKERNVDIIPLAKYFLGLLNSGVKEPKKLKEDALRKLLSYDWPGNIRELQNIIKRAYRLCDDSEIRSEHIDYDNRSRNEWEGLPTPHIGFDMDKYLEDARDYFKKRAKEMTNNNITQASELLGISKGAMSHTHPKKPK